MGLLAFLVLSTLGPEPCRAALFDWTGAVDDLWSTAGNWSPSGPPEGATADVTMAPAEEVEAEIDTNISVGSLTISGGYVKAEGMEIEVDGDLTIDGSGTFHLAGCDITVSGDIILSSDNYVGLTTGFGTVIADNLYAYTSQAITEGTYYANFFFYADADVGLWNSTELVGPVDIFGDLWSMAAITGDVYIEQSASLENFGGYVTSDSVTNEDGTWQIDAPATVTVITLVNYLGAVAIDADTTVNIDTVYNYGTMTIDGDIDFGTLNNDDSRTIMIGPDATGNLGDVYNDGTITIDANADVTWDSWDGNPPE